MQHPAFALLLPHGVRVCQAGATEASDPSKQHLVSYTQFRVYLVLETETENSSPKTFLFWSRHTACGSSDSVSMSCFVCFYSNVHCFCFWGFCCYWFLRNRLFGLRLSRGLFLGWFFVCHKQLFYIRTLLCGAPLCANFVVWKTSTGTMPRKWLF